MEVLQLVSRIPFPLKSGGSIHSYLNAKALAEAGCNVTMLAVNTPKHPPDLDKLPPAFSDGRIDLHIVDIDTSVKPWDAFKNLFSKDSYNVSRFYSPEYEEALIGILEKKQIELVQLEGIFMMPYVSSIRKFSRAKVILRAHNVEHLIWERMAQVEKRPLRKWYLTLLASRLKNYEAQSLGLLDAITAISDSDAEKLRELSGDVQVFVSPPGINRGWAEKSEPIEQVLRFFFIGSMDWMPNKEGLLWLVKEVWPIVKKELPQLELDITGKSLSTEMIEALSSEGLNFIKEAKDAREYILARDVLLVPLLSGSGVRIKILEALALGRAVISTNLGAEGLHLKNDKEIYIADGAEGFARAIIRCYSKPQETILSAKAGRSSVLKKHDNEMLTSLLLDFYKSLMN